MNVIRFPGSWHLRWCIAVLRHFDVLAGAGGVVAVLYAPVVARSGAAAGALPCLPAPDGGAHG